MGPSPSAGVTSGYFTTDFFSPFYFAPLRLESAGGENGGGAFYFAPTFFSRYYFPPLATVTTPPLPTDRPPGDRGGFAAIGDALRATRGFSEVRFAPSTERLPLGAAGLPAAVIVPTGWTEDDDADPITLVRRVQFDLAIVARGESYEETLEQLWRLTSLAQDAIDGSDLKGAAMPALTKLRRASFESRSAFPEQSIVLRGEFTYLLNSFYDHSTE